MKQGHLLGGIAVMRDGDACWPAGGSSAVGEGMGRDSFADFRVQWVAAGCITEKTSEKS